VRVILCDGGKEILATFGDRCRNRAPVSWSARGRDPHRGDRPERRRDGRRGALRGRVDHADRLQDGDLAAGVAASPLARMLADGLRRGVRPGRPHLGAAGLLAARASGVFAVGDMMALNGLPGVAEVACRRASTAARTISGRSRARRPKPFKYRDLGSMATISRRRAIVSFRGIRLHATWAGWPG
jgi:NADH dehydrogenase